MVPTSVQIAKRSQMIKIFYGEDRIKTQLEARKTLGDNYEVIYGESLTPENMPSVFWGSSLFAPQRNILIKDLSFNKNVWELLPQYLTTEHNIVIWEQKLNKNTKVYKALKKSGLEPKEFPAKASPDISLAFNILNTAWRDGPKAVEMLEKIENIQDQRMFIGLMTTQSIRKYDTTHSHKSKTVLKELAKLDMQLKATKSTGQPWSLIEAFLLRVQEMK